MQPEEHEAHHRSLEERVQELERIVNAATTPPAVPPAPVKPSDAA